MRSTAFKVKIEDLVKGRFVPSEEGEPNYLITPWGQKILRANIIGTTVDKFVREDDSYAALQLDDGTGIIRAKAWGEGAKEMRNFNVGDLVTVMGKVREYEGEIHLVPEIIRHVEDSNWELVRELEVLYARKKMLAEGKFPKAELGEEARKEDVLLSTSKAEEIGTVEKLGEPSDRKISEGLKDKLILALDKLEGDEGASSTDLAAELDISQSKAEDALGALLNEDKVYEPRDGKFKLLR